MTAITDIPDAAARRAAAAQMRQPGAALAAHQSVLVDPERHPFGHAAGGAWRKGLISFVQWGIANAVWLDAGQPDPAPAAPCAASAPAGR